MIPKRIEDITATDLQALIANAVREGRTIEYKRELRVDTEGERKEFLADVSSFANASGGDLLFGVEAQAGLPVALVGINGFDVDAGTLRLESMIRDGLDPRVPGIRIKVINVPESDPVLLIRMLKSWSSPHMVSFRDSSKFYARSAAGKFKMDTDELRSAFGLSADVPTRVRAWRDDRLAKILADETPAPIAKTARMVLHLVPVDSLNDPHRIPAAALDGRPEAFRPLSVGNWDFRVNFDGYLTFGIRHGAGEDHPDTTYCQVFRSGRIEAVSADLAPEIRGRNVIRSISYEKELLEGTARYVRALASVGVQPPLIVTVALLGVRGAVFGVDQRFLGDIHAIDRDVLVLPDILIEEPPRNLPRLMRPIFDAAWNACGVPKSLNYNQAGVWAAAPLEQVPMEAQA